MVLLIKWAFIHVIAFYVLWTGYYFCLINIPPHIAKDGNTVTAKITIVCVNDEVCLPSVRYIIIGINGGLTHAKIWNPHRAISVATIIIIVNAVTDKIFFVTSWVLCKNNLPHKKYRKRITIIKIIFCNNWKLNLWFSAIAHKENIAPIETQLNTICIAIAIKLFLINQ